jgi:uncharacterized protein YjiK
MIDVCIRVVLFCICSCICVCCSPPKKEEGAKTKVVAEIAVEAKDSIQDKSIQDKSIQDKLVEDKPIEDKPIEDKLVEDKLVEDKSIEGKSVQDKAIYDFTAPSEVFVLDKKLNEISSLAYNSSENLFITNNDEDGRIFTLDPITFEIRSEDKFAKKGDYEAIELVGDDIIVCQNTGTLYFYNQISKETIKFNTKLSARNDVEGLCFDRDSGALLLACKGQPIAKVKGKKNQKCVYRFDLAKKKLDKDPYLIISDDELKYFVESSNSDKTKSKLKQLKRRAKDFAPSGIAIHPISRDYYLISARGSLLVIIGSNKRVKNVIFLNSKSNPQPEGISFDEDNNLYISTEGKGFSGKIFKFAYDG